LRLPKVELDQVSIISYSFVLKDDICYIYNRNLKHFDEIGTLTQLNDYIDKHTQKLIKDIKQYFYEIDLLEESLYDNHLSSDFMSQWLRYKKDISLIHRLMFDVALSFDLFIKYYKNNKNFKELEYEDQYEHIERIKDLSKVALDKLDHLYDFYRAKVDEKMNKNIYYLTLLSGIFLPLTLVSGFFGMNTGGLPFTNDPNGTWIVFGISVLLEILVFIPFFIQNIKKPKKFKRTK
jgi:magnesium transporter